MTLDGFEVARQASTGCSPWWTRGEPADTCASVTLSDPGIVPVPLPPAVGRAVDVLVGPSWLTCSRCRRGGGSGRERAKYVGEFDNRAGVHRVADLGAAAARGDQTGVP